MAPVSFLCSVPKCGRQSLRVVGRCDSCNRHLCPTHRSPSSHKCDEVSGDATYVSHTVAEINGLRSQINDAAVCELASSLNGGRSCSIEHPSNFGPGTLVGGANYHARIRFHDSPPWLLRVPRVASFPKGHSASFVKYLILNEYATLKFLETTAVPAPRVFACGVGGGNGTDNKIGVSFLLMEELPGKPWTGHGVCGNEATNNEKAKVWNGLADILVELAKHSFPRTGSLCFQSSSVEVSAVASKGFAPFKPEALFDRSIEYYTAFAEQYLADIAHGELYVEYPVDAYLVYRFLKDNAAQLVQHNADAQTPERFFLKHVEDRGDYLLVDENLTITGIIDWQMARVVPMREAFGPSLVTADMESLCQGDVSLSVDDVALAGALEDKGYPELARCTADEKTRIFFWGLAMETEWSSALPLANAILDAFGVDLDYTEWREMALRAYQADERLKFLVESANSTSSASSSQS